MKKLCAGCTVLYQNADSDASKQQQQFDSALRRASRRSSSIRSIPPAAASLVHKAKSQGVKVIAYDRPIPKAKADYYVSFNNQEIGKMFAQSLVDQGQARDARRRRPAEVNGSPTDAAAGLIKKGIHEGSTGSGHKPLAEYDTPELGTRQGPAVGFRAGLAVRRQDHGRRGGQRRHGWRRDRGVQGGAA